MYGWHKKEGPGEDGICALGSDMPHMAAGVALVRLERSWLQRLSNAVMTAHAQPHVMASPTTFGGGHLPPRRESRRLCACNIPCVVAPCGLSHIARNFTSHTHL